MDALKYSETTQFLGDLLKEQRLKDALLVLFFILQFCVFNFNLLPLLPFNKVCTICYGTQSAPCRLSEQVRWLWREIHLVNAQTGGHMKKKKKNHSYFCFSPPFPSSVFVLRLLESSMLNAEVKEGEILPPTIQRLMKGYNKYLRPFFDSKETADTLQPGEMCLRVNKRGSDCNFVLACSFRVIYADI